jgi:hypothetical protein
MHSNLQSNTAHCFIVLESSLMSMKQERSPRYYTMVEAGLTHKYQTRLKNLARDEHPDLMSLGISDNEN